MTTRENSWELIVDRFYFQILEVKPLSTDRYHYFTIDESLIYLPFSRDFGPLNIGKLYRFCSLLVDKLNDDQMREKILVHYTTHEMGKKENAAFLVAAWAVLYQGREVQEVIQHLASFKVVFREFRDAGMTDPSPTLQLSDILLGLKKAHDLAFFDFNVFNVNEYDLLEQPQNGDMNWIVPRRFLACATPRESQEAFPEGSHRTAQEMATLFRTMDINVVIRLNNVTYDRNHFIKSGLEHYDLYFADGSAPTDLVLRRFLDICEKRKGAIAVHCRAGLGRTGTLIAAYLVKYHRFSAREAIGYIRVCRPGSIIGGQQIYLDQIQSQLWQEREIERSKIEMIRLGLTHHNLKSSFSSRKTLITDSSVGAHSFSTSRQSKPHQEAYHQTLNKDPETEDSTNVKGGGGVHLHSDDQVDSRLSYGNSLKQVASNQLRIPS
jgi:cell division cycle 14